MGDEIEAKGGQKRIKRGCCTTKEKPTQENASTSIVVVVVVGVPQPMVSVITLNFTCMVFRISQSHRTQAKSATKQSKAIPWLFVYCYYNTTRFPFHSLNTGPKQKNKNKQKQTLLQLDSHSIPFHSINTGPSVRYQLKRKQERNRKQKKQTNNKKQTFRLVYCCYN